MAGVTTIGDGGTGQSVRNREAGLIPSVAAVGEAEVVVKVLTKAELHESANL
jgi:hypothetical protein